MTTTKKPTAHERLEDIERRPLSPDSLVGSYFHSDAGRGWQGCVVAEPHPGVYLVETFDWIGGTSYEQQLIPIGEMTGWSFYDTAQWMNNAYRNDKHHRWERERVDGGTDDAA